MNQYNVDIVLTDHFIFGLKYFLLAVESILGRNCVDWQLYLWIKVFLDSYMHIQHKLIGDAAQTDRGYSTNW